MAAFCARLKLLPQERHVSFTPKLWARVSIHSSDHCKVRWEADRQHFILFQSGAQKHPSPVTGRRAMKGKNERDLNSEEFPHLRLEYTSRDKDWECWELRYMDFVLVCLLSLDFFPFIFLQKECPDILWTDFTLFFPEHPASTALETWTATIEWKNRI